MTYAEKGVLAVEIGFPRVGRALAEFSTCRIGIGGFLGKVAVHIFSTFCLPAVWILGNVLSKRQGCPTTVALLLLDMSLIQTFDSLYGRDRMNRL